MIRDYKRYGQLRDRVFSHPDRLKRAVAQIAIAQAFRRPVRTIRARNGAGAFERADMANLRQDVRSLAVKVLAQAARCSRLHGAVAQDSERQFGDHGPLISGCVRDHFPPAVKDRLRRLARAASGSAFAYALWRASGASRTTYQREHSRHGFGFYG